MELMEVNGVLEGDRVLLPSQDDAAPLLQGGYGTPHDDGEGSVLSPWEALYLLAEHRLKVRDGATGEDLAFPVLLGKVRAFDPDVWTKYLIYRDLRKRGYVVRDGVGLGIDFRLYARGTYGEKAAKYLVFAVCEGTPLSVQAIQEVLFVALSMKKKVIVAVMDRRGEIVYYSLGAFAL